MTLGQEFHWLRTNARAFGSFQDRATWDSARYRSSSSAGEPQIARIRSSLGHGFRFTEERAGVTHMREPPMYRAFLLALTVLLSLFVTSAEAESGLASYYGGRGHGMTCAHRTRPFGSIVTVRHEGRSIQCRVNDRGPFVRGRVIDLSVSAARALGMMRAGIIRVSVE